jgi:hypothetical protein
LLYSLQSQLYTDFYCLGIPTPSRRDKIASLAKGYTPFVRRLSSANAGKGYWQQGWKVNKLVNGEIVVQRGGLTLWIDNRAYVSAPEGCSIADDVLVGVRFPKESLGISPGFYVASSDTELINDGSYLLVRYYWNVTSEGAISLMQQLTSLLNQIQISFRFKVLNVPDSYERCDAAVLYVNKGDIDQVSSIVRGIYSQIRIHLKQGVPAFTKPLASGLGVAEDPGDGDSFGRHRCQLLAEGIICAYEQRHKSIAARLRVVEECFAKAGISLNAPFLRPDSSDIYECHSNGESVPGVPHHETVNPDRASVRAAFLQTASEIGQRLVRTAMWHDGKCNWMGYEAASSTGRKQFDTQYSALGPALYAGTAGVALFLGEMYAVTGDGETRRTALGAVHQALCRYDSLPPPSRLGLFTGWLGIAYVAVRLGILVNEEELIDEGVKLLRQVAADRCSEREFDLLSGLAGAITALIVLHNALHDGSLLDHATRLGDELVEAAEKSTNGYSWSSRTFPAWPPLTGFSHGTAGIGYALLELFRATGDLRYEKAAFEAFSYERYWFDSQVGNWPDFRDEKRPLGRRHGFSCATFWCHGAPGIALSRLRAFHISKDAICRTEAITALETTRQHTKRWLQSGSGNYSLCHGLAGNAEALIYGSEVLGVSWGCDLAEQVANNGIELYAEGAREWPCGSGGGVSPGLMLGLAGIGYFYLRLHKPSIPSILTITS